ncbi:hypothetical protein QUC31_007232 [Theobroma cacao]
MASFLFIARPQIYLSTLHNFKAKKMGHPAEVEVLSKALSGIGVDEKSLVSILTQSHHEHKRTIKRGCSQFFVEDERHFERWNDDAIKTLKAEFKRFKDAVVFSLLHPWEKHACLLKKALKKGPQQYGVIIEIACTKPSEELLTVRKVYHSLFEGSSEEDLAAHIKGSECKVLDIALRIDVNEDAKKTLTRLIITQEARNLKGVITKYAFKIKKKESKEPTRMC